MERQATEGVLSPTQRGQTRKQTDLGVEPSQPAEGQEVTGSDWEGRPGRGGLGDSKKRTLRRPW